MIKNELQSSLHVDVQARLDKVYGEFTNSELYKPGNSGLGSHMGLSSVIGFVPPMPCGTTNDAVSAQITLTDIKFAVALCFFCYAGYVK